MNRYIPRLSQEPDLNSPALVLSVKAWQNAPSVRVIQDKSMLCSHQQAGLKLDFNDFFGRTAMPAREEAISKRLTSQSFVLK